MDLIDTLKTELALPAYGGLTDQEALDLLYVKDKPAVSLTGKEIFSAQVNADYNGLADAKKAQWLALTSHEDIDPFGPAVQVVIDIWGGGSATVTALDTLRNNHRTRADELGIGTIKLHHIIEARS